MTFITGGGTTVVRIPGGDPGSDLRDALADADCTVAEVGSTGVSALEPLVTVTREGRTAFHARCTPEDLEAVAPELEGDPAGSTMAGTDPDAVVEHDPATTRLPAPDLPGLDVGTRRVLGGCGWRRPTDPTDHEAAGGFVEPDPEAVLAAGETIRGRGWGDWWQDERVGEGWRTARASDGDVTVVVNGHGTPADELLFASAPFEVLDGAESLARAVGADRIVVYASSEDDRAVRTVREAAGNYPDPAASFDVVAGPPEYRAAEPTMAIEAIEGNHRLEARIRPPGPESVGLDGEPTLVHTPRTLAHLAVALRADDPADSRILTVSGDVTAPATVELAETDALGDALAAVDVDGEFKAACVGGRFGGVTRTLEVPAGPEALAEADLGTEGTIQVLAEDRCLVEFVGRRARFAAEENCGRCVPCREGTTQLANLLREIYDGNYDPEGVEELVRVMDASSICTFGTAAGRPTRTAIDEFEPEFEAHADGRCPAGSCLETQEVTS